MRPQRDRPTDRRPSALDGITRWRTWVPLAFVLLSLAALVIVPTVVERRIADRQMLVSEVIEPMRALTSRIRVTHARQFEYIVGYHLTGEDQLREMYTASVQRQEELLEALRELGAAAGSRLTERVDSLESRLNRWRRTVETAGLLGRGVPSDELLTRLSDRYAAYAATASTAESVESEAREVASQIRAEIREAESTRTRLSLVLGGMAFFSAVLVGWLGVRLRRTSIRLERRASNEAALRGIAESLNTATEADPVLHIAVTQVLAPTRTESAYIERIAPSADEVEVVAVHGKGPPPIGMRGRYRGSVTEEVIRAGDAIVIESMERSGLSIAAHLDPSSGDYAALAAPLISANEPLGALVALRPAAKGAFSQDELFRAGAIGYLAAVALRRTIAMDEAETERRERTALLESTTEGIFGLDREGRCRFLNRGAAEMLRLSRKALLGRSLHETIHPRRHDGKPLAEADCPIIRAVRTGRRIRNGEDVFWREDGRPLPVLYSVSPLVEDGDITGAVVAFTDITERRRATEERERLLERERDAKEEAERRGRELERVMESRARFVRGFSHDLKNPLGAAKGHARLLADGVLGTLADDQARAIRSIDGSLETALHLIEDVVELARAEAGQLTVSRKRVDPADIVRASVDEYRGAAADAGLELSLDAPSALEEIETDPTRIREILGNLLSNAVKYTPESGRLRVTIREVGDVRDEPTAPRPGDWSAIDVSDTGPGVPRDKREEIFEEFARHETEGPRGAGLGLAISRRLARLLGGEITLESEVGRGSTFTLWLPRDGPPQNQPRRRK